MLDEFIAQSRVSAEEPESVLQYPANGLRRPGGNAIRDVEEELGAVFCREDFAAIERQHSRQAFKERGLPCPIRPDEAENLTGLHVKAYIRERLNAPESLAKFPGLKQHAKRITCRGALLQFGGGDFLLHAGGSEFQVTDDVGQFLVVIAG